MKKVTVLSAVYDNYDTPKEPISQDGYDVNWVMVTDNEHLHAPGWEIIYQPRPDLHPRRAAKYPKMVPWTFTPSEASVWIDASFRVKSPRFVVDVLNAAKPIAQFTHPWRDCAYDEANESVKLSKFKGQPALRQMSRYRERGFPAHFGLWATGVIARWHTPEIKNFGEHWLYEITHWSFHDQLSHPYCLWEAGLRPDPLPGNHLTNKWVLYQGSGRH